MEIVKKEPYRSKGKGVNYTNDMYRLTITMTTWEFRSFKKWIDESNNKKGQ